jgi:uncharacterized protein GlcG (DUF336 family)
VRRSVALLLGILLAPASHAPAAPAPAVLARHALSLHAAETIAQTALDACTAQGFRVAVAVSDANGELVVLLRSDDAGVHLLDTARRKAFTSASSGARTSVWEKAIDARSGVPDPHLIAVKDILAVGGGVPILLGAERVAAIGVAGSPGIQYDEQCADAGIRAVESLSAPPKP